MTNKTKILFVNDEMTMGGVARVLNTLMANLDPTIFDIDCLVLHKHGQLLDEIPKHVTVLEGTSFFKAVDQPLLEIMKRGDLLMLMSKLRLIFYKKTGLIKKKMLKERLKITTKQYDVEVAAKEGICTIFTAFGTSKRKINWVLTDYSVCNYSKNYMPILKQSLQRIDLNIADSKEALAAYESVFGVSGGKVIHNLMDITKVIEGMKDTTNSLPTSNEINIINVARFHPQKSIDRLLFAHKAALDAGIIHNLYLVGGGESEEQLREIVAKHQLTRVYFLGFMKNPYYLIHQCDLFVLSSAYEGFATIVNESLIAQTPVLMTKVSGASEQILKEEHGWIVENSQEALNEGLIHALRDIEKLHKMKEKLVSYHYPNEENLKQFQIEFLEGKQ